MRQRIRHPHAPSLALSRILIVTALREPVWVWLLQRWAHLCAKPSKNRLH